MKKNIVLTCSLLIGLAFIPVGQVGKQVPSKNYIIADREAMLEKKIESAYTEGEVTLLHESNALRGWLQQVKNKEQKMKDANGGQLSSGNNTELEKELDQVSKKLHRFVRRYTN